MPKDEFIEKVWNVIMADPERGQKGWGLTNHTIKQEGMNSDEIAQVLKKKTHHVIPVIASDQIATLLPLVNNKTQHFGFVINSQSEKNQECIGKQYTLIGKRQKSVTLIALYLSRQKQKCVESNKSCERWLILYTLSSR